MSLLFGSRCPKTIILGLPFSNRIAKYLVFTCGTLNWILVDLFRVQSHHPRDDHRLQTSFIPCPLVIHWRNNCRYPLVPNNWFNSTSGLIAEFCDPFVGQLVNSQMAVDMRLFVGGKAHRLTANKGNATTGVLAQLIAQIFFCHIQ